jgi:predicted GNAT family acetyltransferase
VTEQPISIRVEDGRDGAFVAERNGDRLGDLTFHRRADSNIITLVHTEVLPAGRGGGVGRRLVEAAVDFAREHQLKVVVICRYAKTVFEREPGLRDVLA